MVTTTRIQPAPPLAFPASALAHLPLVLVAVAASFEGFPKPPVSYETALACLLAAVLIVAIALWRRWMTLAHAIYSFFPMLLVGVFDEITTVYKTPFIFSSVAIAFLGGLIYQRFQDRRASAWVVLVVAGIATYVFAYHASLNFWGMTTALGIHQCFLDYPGCPSLTGLETPWWQLAWMP